MSFEFHFGRKNSGIDFLKQKYPHISFKRIRQTHGKRVVHTSLHSIDFAQEADAHYTSEKNLGLCISTADCIPALIYHENPRWIAAIHAGWRGVENQILKATVQQLQRLNCKPEDMKILVGAHIQKQSFEVEADVKDKLIKISKPEFADQISDKKYLVDLHRIFEFQMKSLGINLNNVTWEKIDTATSPEHHSFRRDKEASGRMLSFISLC
jgi:YfiH family protein